MCRAPFQNGGECSVVVQCVSRRCTAVDRSFCLQHVRYTQTCESTHLVQRLCAAEAVSSDCVPRCRRAVVVVVCSRMQLPEAVRPLHLSQMWAQVLQPPLLPIRGERCSVYILCSYIHNTSEMCSTYVCTYVLVLKLTHIIHTIVSNPWPILCYTEFVNLEGKWLDAMSLR